MRRNAIVILVVAAALVGISLTAGRSADHAILTGNHPEAAATSASLGNADLDQALTMEIHFAIRNRAELDRLLKEQQDRSSPNFRKWLKTGEFASRFGVRDTDVKAVADWLNSEGFAVESTSPRAIKFSGDVDHAQRSFAVRIARFDDGSVYSNIEDPSIPAQFAGLISTVSGLDNMAHVVPVGLDRKPRKGPSLNPLQAEILALNASEPSLDSVASAHTASPMPLAVVNGQQAFGPQDMRTFYDESVGPGSDGTGSCIGIIGASDVSPDALDLFDNQFGLPAINLTRVIQSTNPGETGDGYEQEAELDLNWAHAMAPGAAEKLFLAENFNNQPIIDDIGSVIEDNTCSVVSISFGICGDVAISEFTDVLYGDFQQAAAQGQSVFIGSGDQGAAALVEVGKAECNPTNKRGLSELPTDPFITAVGGTQFTPTYDQNGNDVGYSQEVVWSNTGGDFSPGASGGGVSALFAKPHYQTGPGVPADTNRDIPDVALMAGAPYAFFGDASRGLPAVFGFTSGTSLATPVMAGLVSVLSQQMGERLGNVNEIIYPLARQQYGPQGAANGFHDITSGNNSFNGVTGYSAGPGYDQATGWGSIDFDVFAAAVKNNPLPSVTATPVATATPTTSMLPAPAQIKFGNLDATGSGPAHKVSITNKGTVDAIVGAVTAHAGFAIGTDQCSGQTVAPKKSCTMLVEFTPSVVGVAEGSISVPYNGGTATTIISGTGTAVLLRVPSSVKFAAVAAGSTGARKLVAITNASKTATVQMGTASLNGPFIKSSDTCSGTSVPPKKACAIGVEFAPTSIGTTSGSLGITYTYGSNSGSARTISLSGAVQ